MTRDLVSFSDLADADATSLLDAAAEFSKDVRAGLGRRRDAVMATLFMEPSTRTRLSFEAAMLRLGGGVVTSADPKGASTSKGETLADTVRMTDGYADVIVLRHPLEGAARLAAETARRPVINAGDGGREHPTQTLVDLFTLRRRLGSLAGRLVVLWGDLRYGRTTHSLAPALVRFGARVLLLAEPGLEFPAATLKSLARDGAPTARVEVAGAEASFGGRPEAILIGAAAGGEGAIALDRDPPDALYVTRVQTERLPPGSGGARRLPTIDRRFLEARPFARTAVLHPLPRVGEIARDVDDDPRAAYFEQAEAGVPVRMALIDAVLGGAEGWARSRPAESRTPPLCRKARCVTSAEPPHEVAAAPGSDCAYCGGAV